MSHNVARKIGGSLLAAAVLLAASPAQAADKAAEKPAAAKSEKPSPPEKPDPFVVPKGTPEDLLKYIEGLKQARPSAENREAVLDFVKRRSQALLTASEAILAGKPEPEQAKAAIQFKIIALMTLEQLGEKDAAKRLEAFPAELEKAGLKDLVWQARCALIGSRLRQTREMSEADFTKLSDEVKECLTESGFDRQAAQLALSLAMNAEYNDQAALAVKAYQQFGKLLSAAKDKEVAGTGAMMEGAARRLGMVGKTMTLEGARLDGKPLDWSKYKGKVVLVDFWATWCGPCRAEIPNMEKNYQAYHDRGFDIVGISIDQDRKALEDFVAEKKLPWVIVHDGTEARGTDKSMSTYYGVFGIPQMILVGRDGKVISVGARGPELDEQLEKLLGPAEAETKDKKDKNTKDKKKTVKEK